MSDHALRIISAFVLHAASAGGIYVRLPEIQAYLGISEAIYGLVLLAMPIGVLSGSLTVPKRIERFGAPRIIGFGLAIAGFLQIAVAVAPNSVVMALLLYVYGFAFAGANVGINVEANRYEADTGSKIMSRCHGWWALGFLATSLAAAGLIRLGVSPAMQFVGHAVLMAVLVSVLVLPMPNIPAPAAGKPARRLAVPTLPVLMIGAWAVAGLLMEGTVRGWIVIYARDYFGATEAMAALTLPTIILTQTIGRFTADHFVARIGIVTVARGSAVVLALGVLVIVLASNTQILLFGCLLIGLGIAINMPQAFAAAGRLTDGNATENVAAFATLSTLIGFMGPPLFGVLAELIGLRIAFALVLPVAAVSYLMARVLRS